MLEFVMSSLIAVMAFCVSSQGLDKKISSCSDLYTRPKPKKSFRLIYYTFRIYGHNHIHTMSMTRTTHK